MDKVDEVTDSVKVVIKDKANEVLDSVAKEKAAEAVDSIIGDKATEKVEEVIGVKVDDVKDKLKDWNPFKKKKKNQDKETDGKKD